MSLQLLLISGVLLVVAIAIGIISENLMVGYDDCSMLHTVRATKDFNCASDLRMLMQVVFRYAAFILGFGAFLIPIFIDWRRQKLEKDEIESIKIS